MMKHSKTLYRSAKFLLVAKDPQSNSVERFECSSFWFGDHLSHNLKFKFWITKNIAEVDSDIIRKRAQNWRGNGLWSNKFGQRRHRKRNRKETSRKRPTRAHVLAWNWSNSRRNLPPNVTCHEWAHMQHSIAVASRAAMRMRSWRRQPRRQATESIILLGGSSGAVTYQKWRGHWVNDSSIMSQNI